MLEEKRKLIKFSNYSLCVTLPKSVITKLKWVKGDIVSMRVNENSKEIVISKNNTSKAINVKRGDSTQKDKIVAQEKTKKARW